MNPNPLTLVPRKLHASGQEKRPFPQGPGHGVWGGCFISHRVCDDNFLIFPLLCPDTPTLPGAVEDEVEERKRRREREKKPSHSCQELGQIRKSHSYLSCKDPKLKVLYLLEEKSQMQIKEGGVRELAGLYMKVGLHSRLRGG